MFRVWECGCIGFPEGQGAWIVKDCKQGSKITWIYRPQQGTEPTIPLDQGVEQALHAEIQWTVGRANAYDRLQDELRMLVGK